MRLREFYEAYRGAKIYNAPLLDENGTLLGNHGDHLMVLGGKRIHQDLEMEYVDDPADAELLIIGGNGGMFGWSDKGIPEILSRLSREFPNTPICMEPATFYFPNQSISRLLPPAREAPVVLFCREQYSYRSLTEDDERPDFCQIELDHDTALELKDTDLVQSLIGKPGKHVLFVERTDMEHPSAGFEISKGRKRLNGLCPAPVKRMLYPLVTRWRARQQSEFVQQCRGILKKDHAPEISKLPAIACDLSNVNTCTFEEFLEQIASASVVFTQRLHIGLLSSMLGKPTYVFDGPYFKIRAIYEHSLSDLDHVHFVPNPDGYVVPERGRTPAPALATE